MTSHATLWQCVNTPFTRYNRLSKRLPVDRTATVRSTGCQTGLYNRFDNNRPLHFQAGCRKRRVNLALVFYVFILCSFVFWYFVWLGIFGLLLFYVVSTGAINCLR